MMIRLWLAAAFLCLSPTAGAATIAVYDFTGLPGDEASVAATPFVANATFGPITRGSSLTPDSGPSTEPGLNSINSTGWVSAESANTNYYTFTITPDGGTTLQLSSLEYTDRRSATGPTSFDVRFGAGGLSTSTSIGTYTLGTGDTSNHREVFDLSRFAALSNLATPETFWIVASGAVGDAGTYRLGVNGTPTGPNPANLELIGQTAAVLEPSGVMLLGAGLIGAGWILRGRFRHDGRPATAGRTG